MTRQVICPTGKSVLIDSGQSPLSGRLKAGRNRVRRKTNFASRFKPIGCSGRLR
jgi:hypothetical protein